jgi:hypothetical protein
MSTKTTEIHNDIEELIEKQAKKHDVPRGLLRDVFIEEKKVVNMENRHGIHGEVKDIIEDYAEDQEE